MQKQDIRYRFCNIINMSRS